MNADAVAQDFQQKVSKMIRLTREGTDRFRVFTPFVLEDGDHLVIVLKKIDGEWALSDEACTLMHLTYDIDEKDLQRGTRRKIISDTLSTYQLEDRNGEFVHVVPDERFGDALYTFIQALLRVTDVTFLSRERARSTFMDDFRAFIGDRIPEHRLEFNWHDAVQDPRGHYMVDCRINGMERPLMVHALPNDARARDATITLLQFEKWRFAVRSLAIFEDQESINPKVLARFSDVGGKLFSSLSGNRERIARFLDDVVTD